MIAKGRRQITGRRTTAPIRYSIGIKEKTNAQNRDIVIIDHISYHDRAPMIVISSPFVSVNHEKAFLSALRASLSEDR